MRYIGRTSLQVKTVRTLARKTLAVSSSPDPKVKAAALWKSFDGKAKDDVSATLRSMASGLERCMYCEDGHGTDIEHFRPKSLYPNQAFEWTNYLLACSECNSNFKRSQFPLSPTGDPLLLDPTTDDPLKHLELSSTTGDFSYKTLEGASSIRVFGLNRQVCSTGRRDAFVTLLALIEMYDAAQNSGKKKQAQQLLQAMRNHPFQSVRSFVAGFSQSRLKTDLPAHVIPILKRRPEVLN